ncbi:tyrosine-type recombinase/integrase [Nonomuraea wenchangensis]|uniref:Phage integrase family protein n=1 Tax=Nonomuraea wenchangensis TaxID=568860 RepID=A0A1I0L928_9ACTN|nr:tyrosine-type recombinase/integrase [Nonomuraea wenchangensis]SEU36340.1 Phage integrase family protein [Nonomuraea wenchangensis]
MGVLGQRDRPPTAPIVAPAGRHRPHPRPAVLSERRPVPARRPAAADICPHTGRARLGYDRARVLLDKYAGLDLHQLRHSAATHLGEAEVPLQLIMGKTRHKNPRTAMRYVKPGAEAIAKVTEAWHPAAVPTDQLSGGSPKL